MYVSDVVSSERLTEKLQVLLNEFGRNCVGMSLKLNFEESKRIVFSKEMVWQTENEAKRKRTGEGEKA